MNASHLSQAISVATLRSGVMQEVVRFLNTHPLLHHNGIAFKIEFKEPSGYSLQLNVDDGRKRVDKQLRSVKRLGSGDSTYKELLDDLTRRADQRDSKTEVAVPRGLCVAVPAAVDSDTVGLVAQYIVAVLTAAYVDKMIASFECVKSLEFEVDDATALPSYLPNECPSLDHEVGGCLRAAAAILGGNRAEMGEADRVVTEYLKQVPEEPKPKPTVAFDPLETKTKDGVMVWKHGMWIWGTADATKSET
jgi:hypothetical protein